ncbi:YciI family protein [Massilia niastensis]|uniref:YciI family protein n=1 Tax=Massilia niastensis TaxID=544911 RepID=UPI00036E1487|nr:YciI family protein [Massilia niastensis]
MRFMILLKADKNTEAGHMPSEQLLADMGRFNDELIKAGVMQAGEGLHPSSRGARVHFSKDGGVRVEEGPFADTNGLVCGFWIWRVASREEAIEWVKRVPMPHESGEADIEIRQIFEMEDFGELMTPELRAQEERQRAQLGG